MKPTYEIYVVVFITQDGKRGIVPDADQNPMRFLDVERAYAKGENLPNPRYWDVMTLDHARTFVRPQVPQPSGR